MVRSIDSKREPTIIVEPRFWKYLVFLMFCFIFSLAFCRRVWVNTDLVAGRLSTFRFPLCVVVVLSVE